MLNKKIAIQTLQALEDHLDELTTDGDEAQAASLQTLINFWRMYAAFLPEEDDDVC